MGAVRAVRYFFLFAASQILPAVGDLITLIERAGTSDGFGGSGGTLTQSTNQFDFVGPDKSGVRPTDVVALPHPGELPRLRSRKIKTTVQASSELPENMTDSPSQLDPARQHHDKGLVIIAGYKFLLGLMFIGIGIGALHLLHKDIEDVLTQLAIAIRFNPESRIVNFLVDKASFLDDHMLAADWRPGLYSRVFALGMIVSILKKPPG